MVKVMVLGVRNPSSFIMDCGSKWVSSNRYKLSRSRCQGCGMCRHNSIGLGDCRLNRHKLSRAGCQNMKTFFHRGLI